MKIGSKELRETNIWLIIIIRQSRIKSGKIVESGLSECQESIRIFAKSISTAKNKL